MSDRRRDTRVADYFRADRDIDQLLAGYAAMPHSEAPQPGSVALAMLGHAVTLFYSAFDQNRAKTRDFISDAIDSKLDDIDAVTAQAGGKAAINELTDAVVADLRKGGKPFEPEGIHAVIDRIMAEKGMKS